MKKNCVVRKFKCICELKATATTQTASLLKKCSDGDKDAGVERCCSDSKAEWIGLFAAKRSFNCRQMSASSKQVFDEAQHEVLCKAQFAKRSSRSPSRVKRCEVVGKSTVERDPLLCPRRQDVCLRENVLQTFKCAKSAPFHDFQN